MRPAHVLNYHSGRPHFHFDEASDAAAAASAAAAAAAAAKTPWHTGIDAEYIGHAQNKGWKLDDPKEAFVAAIKQAREAEKHFGVPVDRLLKLPATDAKPEDIAAFHQRLGAPKEPKEYDFSGIKRSGADLDAGFADAMRAGLAAAFVPKDKAGAIVASVTKYLDDADAAQATVSAGKLAAEKAALATNWGPKFQFNHLQAMEGARKAGITPEAITAMEGQAGYASVMEHFRRLGASMSESAYHEGGTAGTGPTTQQGAIARLAELEGDKAWGKRLTSGDAVATAEWHSLMALISGQAA